MWPRPQDSWWYGLYGIWRIVWVTSIKVDIHADEKTLVNCWKHSLPRPWCYRQKTRDEQLWTCLIIGQSHLLLTMVERTQYSWNLTKEICSNPLNSHSYTPKGFGNLVWGVIAKVMVLQAKSLRGRNHSLLLWLEAHLTPSSPWLMTWFTWNQWTICVTRLKVVIHTHEKNLVTFQKQSLVRSWWYRQKA